MRPPIFATIRLALCLSPLALFPGAIALPSLGCSNCPPWQPVEKFSGGHVYPEGYYETSAPDEGMLAFRGGRAYEIEHRLGKMPRAALPYLSFVAHPKLDPDGPSMDNVALAAGNQALIQGWDERVVIVRNDTCADYFLRVVVLADGVGGEGGAP